MEHQRRNVHRTLAFLSFLVPFVTYYLTAWPSISPGDSGMLAAAASGGQILDAPGAPLWVTIAGAFVNILPGDPARLLVIFSAICGGLSAMLLYLLTTSLLSSQYEIPVEDDKSQSKGGSGEGEEESSEGVTQPSSLNLPNIIGGITGWGGFVAALSFAWFDSQWRNSTEITTHSAGTLLVILTLWGVVQWYRGRQLGSGRSTLWLLLAAWSLGLVLGVDRIALAVLPAAALLIWIVQFIPEKGDSPRFVLSGTLGMFGLLLLWHFFIFDYLFVALLAGLIALLIASFSPRLRRGALAGTFVLLFLLGGYTTYVQVVVRTEAHPPLRLIEEEPSLGGGVNLLRYANAPVSAISSTSDNGNVQTETSLSYTVGHLYTRYLLWNLVGRISNVVGSPALLFSVSDQEQDEFVVPVGRERGGPIYFYALPLLLVCIGFAYHFRHDWRTALSMIAGFLTLGPLLALYLDPAPPLTFEIDHLFASSLIFPAIWIGFATTGLARSLFNSVASEERRKGGKENVVMGVILLCFLIAPLNLVWSGWEFHSRRDNYLPHDFAHNLLVSCDSNAVLFVADRISASPLYYLQDVESLRRDVRVVEIDQLNLWWYRDQLGGERSRDGLPLAMSLPAGKLVKPPLIHRVDSAQRVPLSIRHDSTGRADTLWWAWRGTELDSGMVRYSLREQVIKDIVEQNIGERPIYFAITVPSQWWGGLERFFRWEGMALRVVPERGLKGVEGFSEFAINHDKMRSLLMPEGEGGFRLRGLNDPDVGFGLEERQSITYYRRALLALAADGMKNRSDTAEAVALLDALDKTISIKIFPMPYWMGAVVASLYRDAGNREGTERYAEHTIEEAEQVGDAWRNHPVDRRYNPYQIRARRHALLGDYDRAIESYRSMSRDIESDPVLRGLIEELRVERHLVKGDSAGAIRELREIVGAYGSPNTPALQNNLSAWQQMLGEMDRGADTSTK